MMRFVCIFHPLVTDHFHGYFPCAHKHQSKMGAGQGFFDTEMLIGEVCNLPLFYDPFHCHYKHRGIRVKSKIFNRILNLCLFFCITSSSTSSSVKTATEY